MCSFAPSKTNKHSFALIALGLLAGYIWFLYLRNVDPGLSIPYAQKYVAPLVFIAIACAGVWIAKVPKTVFVCAAFFAVIGVSLGFGFSKYNPHTFLVGRLVGDDLETRSRILREEIRENLPANSSVEVTRYHSEINRQDVKEIFAKNGRLQLLARSVKDGLVLSFREQEAKELNEIIPTDAHDWLNLSDELRIPLAKQRFIELVSEVRLPLEPFDASAQFLADFSAGSLSGYLSNPLGKRMSATNELDLKTAAVRGAFWKTQAHRALAAFLLGNHYFGLAFKGDFEAGYLDCAISSYALASGMVSDKENYPLYSAIYNNLGVIRSLQVYFEDIPENSKLARANFLKAQRGAPVKKGADRELIAYKAASKNFAKMAVLRGNTERKGKKRRKLAKQK